MSKRKREVPLASRVFQVEIKDPPDTKIYVKITAFPESGIALEVKRGHHSEGIDRNDLLRQLRSKKDEATFFRHYALVEKQLEKYLNQGDEPIIKEIVPKLWRVVGKVDLQNWTKGGMTIQKYNKKKRAWRPAFDGIGGWALEEFKGKDREKLLEVGGQIADRLAKLLERKLPHAQFFHDIKAAVYINPELNSCETVFRNRYGVYYSQSSLDLQRQPVEIQKRLEKAEKRCIKMNDVRFAKTTNTTIHKPERWWNDEIQYQYKQEMIRSRDHRYICPQKDNPKACFFDEETKRCIEPPDKKMNCRRIRNLAQNRTRDLDLLLSQERSFLGRSRNPCMIFRAAAETGGSSVNFNNTLLKRVGEEYKQREIVPKFEETKDLWDLWKIVDHIYFDDSLTDYFDQRSKLPELVVETDSKLPYFGLYDWPPENTIHINIASITEAWERIQQKKKSYLDEKKEGVPFLKQDNTETKSLFLMIVKVFLHELAHYLQSNIENCDSFGQHDINWLMLHKYFFGGGDSHVMSDGVRFTVD